MNALLLNLCLLKSPNQICVSMYQGIYSVEKREKRLCVMTQSSLTERMSLRILSLAESRKRRKKLEKEEGRKEDEERRAKTTKGKTRKTGKETNMRTKIKTDKARRRKSKKIQWKHKGRNKKSK